MKRSPSIQLKAAFLLIVFSLNTVVGFACSIGLDRGFNSSHHQEEKTFITHKHSKSHHEDKAENHHSSKEGKGNCCKDEAVKFAKVDKLIPQSSTIIVSPVFFTAFFSSFYYFDAFASYRIISNNKFFVRSHHPPISDIRVAIQSFQI